MSENSDYGITVFKRGTPLRTRVWKLVFLGLFIVIALVEAFFWLFANSVQPIILGMPFGMFFVVLFIAVSFVVLLALYRLDSTEPED